MKKMIIPAVIVLIVLFFGCKKIKNLANINIDIPYSTEVTIPQVTGSSVPVPGQGATLDFPQVSVATNSKEYMVQYHTDADNIRQVDLKSLGMQILTPPSQNFDFLDTVQLYISAGALPEVLIAYQYVIPKGATALEFVTITEVNLKDYFLADTMRLHMRAHINAVPAEGAKLKIDSKFHMLANPLY